MAATTSEPAATMIDTDGVRLTGAEHLSGLIELRTAAGAELYRTGEAFFSAPRHAPIALEGSEDAGFSPTSELAPVLAHLTGTP